MNGTTKSSRLAKSRSTKSITANQITLEIIDFGSDPRLSTICSPWPPFNVPIYHNNWVIILSVPVFHTLSLCARALCHVITLVVVVITRGPPLIGHGLSKGIDYTYTCHNAMKHAKSRYFKSPYLHRTKAIIINMMPKQLNTMPTITMMLKSFRG